MYFDPPNDRTGRPRTHAAGRAHPEMEMQKKSDACEDAGVCNWEPPKEIPRCFKMSLASLKKPSGELPGGGEGIGGAPQRVLLSAFHDSRLKSHAGCNAFMDGLGKLTNRDRA